MIRQSFAVAAAAVLLSGCVAKPQLAIPMDSARLTAATKIGVVMTNLPPVTTHLPGAGCLLCLAAAEIANADLTKHAKTLPYEGLADLGQKLADALTQRGLNATLIPGRIDVAKLPKSAKAPDSPPRNFRELGAKHGVDKLLVLEVNSLGFLRTYNNYFPTSDPKAWSSGYGYMVDVKTNAYDWYMPLDVQRAGTGTWDEPPSFPGLTNAYFQVIEITQDTYLTEFRGPAAAAPPASAASN